MDKLKKLAKALAKKRGISYQAAHNLLTGHGSSGGPPGRGGTPPNGPLLSILTALRASANEGAGFIPVMTGVPIALKVERQGDGRHFVECNVSPFSSPFLVVHENKETALRVIAETLLALMKELQTRGGPFIDNPLYGPTKADFDFDGRHFEVEAPTWVQAHEALKRLKVRVAGYLERLAGLRPVRAYRYIEAHCDYETSEHAGAGGMFQVIELKEGDDDVTDLVDQGILFSSIAGLQRHLREVTGDDVEVEEVG